MTIEKGSLIYRVRLNLTKPEKDKIDRFLVTIEEEDYFYSLWAASTESDSICTFITPRVTRCCGLIDFYNYYDYSYFMLLFNGDMTE